MPSAATSFSFNGTGGSSSVRCIPHAAQAGNSQALHRLEVATSPRPYKRKSLCRCSSPHSEQGCQARRLGLVPPAGEVAVGVVAGVVAAGFCGPRLQFSQTHSSSFLAASGRGTARHTAQGLYRWNGQRQSPFLSRWFHITGVSGRASHSLHFGNWHAMHLQMCARRSPCRNCRQ